MKLRPQPELPDSPRTMQVVDHIRQLIEDGTLKPGDKIPPEREFAQLLKISRASLRTGIGFLSAIGVMNVRHGVGTFVADGPPEFGKTSMNLLGALHGFQPWQMYEARRLLEGNLAALAAERSRPEQMMALADEVAELFACIESPKDFLYHDILFHRIVAQASGNPILVALIETLTSALYEHRLQTAEQSTSLREAAEMHRMIYKAIGNKDAAEAKRLMEEHLQESERAQEQERPLASGRVRKAAATKTGK